MEKTSVTAPPKIYSAMAKIMEGLKAVPKTGKNSFQGYNYQGIAEIMDALHPLMGQYKVALSPRTISIEKDIQETLDSNGKAKTSMVVFKQVEFSFISLEDGSVFEPRPLFEGLGVDNSDKADSKASTFAYKKMLQQVFCIPTNDIIDPDAGEPELPKKKTAPATITTPAQAVAAAKQLQSELTVERALKEIDGAKTIEDLQRIVKRYSHLNDDPVYKNAGAAKKAEILNSNKPASATAVEDAINRQSSLDLKTA